MSIDHSFVVSKSEKATLKLNISSLNDTPQSADHLKGNFYAYDETTADVAFTTQFSIEDLRGLYHFLDQYSVIKDVKAETTGRIIEITKDMEAIGALFERVDREDILKVLKPIVLSRLSRKDISTLLGRKDAMSVFSELLEKQKDTKEPVWQHFFESNNWIFGYGLDYRYLGILQREANVSRTALDGSGSVISDFLMSDSRFTKLVELKRPDTALFEKDQNRSDSWKLSKDLTYAVSQILAQKANWDFESHHENFDSDGNSIQEETHDVGCVLIIGHSDQFTGSNKVKSIMRKTFELYRRNLRNIDILLFDELYDRANQLVQNEEE
jgi:hypothetical protein